MSVRKAKKILKRIYGSDNVTYLKDRKLFRVLNRGQIVLIYL